MRMMLDLPNGPRGRLLALALTLGALLLAWFAAAGPLLRWYADRQEALVQRTRLEQRMAELVVTLPTLEQQAAGLGAGTAAPEAVLAGDTDAIAGATLQERLQAMARSAGTSLSSVEMLPATPAGSFRRIGLRVAMETALPNAVHLLQQIAQAQPRMVVGELQLQSHLLVARPTEPDVDARFVVYAFRTTTPAAKPE